VAEAQSAKSLTGAGATFPAVLYSKWTEEYRKLTGLEINYQAIGSGGGIKAHQELTADFGATDGPMNETQLKDARGGATLHIPMALGAVVATYNLPKVTSPLSFTGDVLADIFLGKITMWNDPRLVELNPAAALPKQDIIVVHRSDGSGTSYIWTDYLSNLSSEWKEKVGNANSVNWPTGIGGQGNAGVAGEVKNNEGSLGYVELAYARQNKLGFGSVRNSAGYVTAPSLASVTAAAAGALRTMSDDLRVSIVNPAGPGAYPIAGFTWILAYRQQRDAAKGRALADYLFWCITDGQKYCGDLDYAPLPKAMLPLAYAKIESMNTQGSTLLAAGSRLPLQINLVNNGDGTETASYDNGTTDKRPVAMTIVETAVAAGSFSTLLAAATAADLVTTLSGPGPLTVFAPTDEAFAKLGQATIDEVLADKEKLTAILTYHVVGGAVMAKDVVKLTSAKTVQGGEIKIDAKGAVKINDATVVKADIQCGNGVIHVIDTVLLPA
jgi:phosphate transport system substrate-binding protein